MTSTSQITVTGEDYLEAILRLVNEKGAARVRDIASVLSVHKSTVSASLKSLSERGFVNYSPYEITTLTPQGREIAEDVTRRHEIVRDFFVEVLAVEDGVANANACRAEHILDADVLDRLATFARFIQDCPTAREQCLKQFRAYYRRRAKASGGVCLDQLRPGQKGKIARVAGAATVRRRMAAIGVVRGAPVEVVDSPQLGESIELKLNGRPLALQKREAADIHVEI